MITAPAQRTPDIEAQLAALEMQDGESGGELCPHAAYMPDDSQWYLIPSRRGPKHALICCRACAIRQLEIRDATPAGRTDNVVPLRSDYPCPPVGVRFSEHEYQDPPRWMIIAAYSLCAAVIIAALMIMPAAQPFDHGQRIPTGIGGSDTGGSK